MRDMVELLGVAWIR